MIASMAQFFSSIWSIFTSTNIPGTSIPFSTLYLAGLAVATLSFALGKLFHTGGMSGGFRIGKNRRRKAGDTE